MKLFKAKILALLTLLFCLMSNVQVQAQQLKHPRLARKKHTL
jgi:hypothetical protein